MVCNLTIHVLAMSRKMMSEPGWWPNGYVLPIKRGPAPSKDDKDLALMLAEDVNKGVWKIYFCNLLLAALCKEHPSKTFKSLDELLEDGWEVD